METEICAGGIIYKILEEDTLFLLIKSSSTGWWVFPKGHVEEGETIFETAKREIFEETGLKDLEHIEGFSETISFINNKGNQKNVHHFLFKSVDEDLIISDEHLEYQWLNFSDAHELIDHENQKRILKIAHEIIQNERD